MADEFGLSVAEREERTAGDGESRIHWEKMVRWARQKLLDRGLLQSSQRGVGEVTPDGIEFLRAEAEANSDDATGSPPFLPEEVAQSTRYVEGAIRRITVNAYERNLEARRQCIAVHGFRCCICGFDFGVVYGPEFAGFIHVHHRRPLCEIAGDYEVDPVEDLQPVCPNCHAVIHHGGQLRDTGEVGELLKGTRNA